MDTSQQLIAYTHWANRAWLEFVFGEAEADAYLAGMISHIYLAERVWFQRIHDEPLDSDIFATLSHEELLDTAAKCEARYGEQLNADLSRVLKYSRMNGDPMASTIEDILNHLITHASHHRGQMATYASEKNLGAPETSYITYTRKK